MERPNGCSSSTIIALIHPSDACNLRPCIGSWHEVEWRSARNEFFSLLAFFERAHDAVRMLHHPPAHITLVDGLAFFRVLHEVRDAGKAEPQLRIVEVLLALEVDLEVLPLDGVQFFVEPYHAILPVRVLLLAEEEWALILAVDDPV